MEIEVDTVENIGGIKVHRIGGSMQNDYNEIVLFLSKGKLMQINYWVSLPIDEDIMNKMNEIILSLRYI